MEFPRMLSQKFWFSKNLNKYFCKKFYLFTCCQSFYVNIPVIKRARIFLKQVHFFMGCYGQH
jgi:hypothetical protein